MTDLVCLGAHGGWRLVLALITAANDEALGVVAAGPLEDYVRAHAATSISVIEEQAAVDDRFRDALAGVWVWPALPSTLFERVAKAARSSLDRPPDIDAAAELRAWYRRHDELWSIIQDEDASADERARAEQALDAMTHNP